MNTNQNEIILYQRDNAVEVEVRLENENVWLTQAQIALLFGVKVPAISKHLKNIYDSGELEQDSTFSILENMGNDGKQEMVCIFKNRNGSKNIAAKHIVKNYKSICQRTFFCRG